MNVRVRYVDAALAHRAAIAKATAVKWRLKPSHRATLDAVIVLTASYSKLEDRVHIAAVAEIAGYHESTVRGCLKTLGELNVIRYEPTRSPRKRSLIGLHSADLDARSGEDLDARSLRGSRCADTEKGSEEFSEEGSDWVEDCGFTEAAA